MKPVYGKVDCPKQSFFRFNAKTISRSDFLWHFHDVYELNLVVCGRGTRFVGDHIGHYKDDDLVMMGPHLPHTWYSDPLLLNGANVHKSINIQFTANFLGDSLFLEPGWKHVVRLLQIGERGVLFTGHTQRQVSQLVRDLNSHRGPLRLIKFLTILDALGQSSEYEILSGREYNPILDPSSEKRIDKVWRFISENYTRPISLPEAAATANLSVSAFCDFFKRTAGKTFVSYVNELRVGLACKLLVETDRSVSAIAYESGFNNISNFNRRFLEVKKVSPKRYRQQFAVDA